MKVIIYYGHDGAAAKAFAAELREAKHAAQVRHAPFFDQPEKADDIVILECVSDFDRGRIEAAYRAALEATGVLRQDGPTVEEYVAAGYSASVYPPKGYASRSTPEEIAAAIAAQINPAPPPANPVEPTDDELRAALTAAGKPPHPQTGRKKLLEKYNALKATE
ncbi:hypothetical protein [Rhizobium sp. NLR22b]|uniref:hypothetical protein n=1 Tax=Rhizobium sp. NLR22b TaxID=2731115 RepID=UPI001C82C4CF|nr:hypothetical protein [Rhizobium sp. NLR22b]MBX5238629.1 hypothetical protein [Rhizobium sp. NLR22b]